MAVSMLLALAAAGRRTGSARLRWLLVFGAVFGVLELGVDGFHVRVLGSFVYTYYSGLRLAASPWYMPVGWWVTAVQFGYVALRATDLADRRWKAVAGTAVLGMLLPP